MFKDNEMFKTLFAKEDLIRYYYFSNIYILY